MDNNTKEPSGLIAFLIKYCLKNKFIVFSLFLIILGLGIYVAPFDWNLGVERNPVHVDAIPDIGENQQIVFTEWNGRSPRDIEDQVTYPLTVNLMGLPGVKALRATSMFGFSVIYVIFQDNVDFYWARTRILEKLNSLPANTLPIGVTPRLGPDATALGQVFWYTLEGVDKNGNPTGGWDSYELRSIQDWIVKYALLSVEGVSEVASVGGYVKEYQVDLDPDAMRVYHVGIEDITKAIRESNIDVGSKVLDINGVEYILRGLGYVKRIKDIENSVIKEVNNTPVFIKNVANVSLGPAYRRGFLDKGGAEAVGGVVTVRYGGNPLETINKVKKKIDEISSALPKKTLENGTVSKLKIVPFYDRSGLIYETLGTLNSALFEEILITIIVIIIMVRHFRIATLISGLMPAGVLFAFVLMKIFNIDANIVALSGIAIAIGTIVDMGIVICENIINHLNEASPDESSLKIIHRASSEVGGAVLTSVSTTIISFLPVFALQSAEGKLFHPLAFTKTFTLFASCIIALFIIPPLAHILLRKKTGKKKRNSSIFIALIIVLLGILSFIYIGWKSGLFIIVIGFYQLVKDYIPKKWNILIFNGFYILCALLLGFVLARHWLPIGPEKGILMNTFFVILPIAALLSFFAIFQHYYKYILGFCLNHKKLFLSLIIFIIIFGLISWIGIKPITNHLPERIRDSKICSKVISIFPGLGNEFMPALNEGSFLMMPSVMPHASIREVKDVIQKQDIAISKIPEINLAVGKAGRADTALDSAPLSMIETIIDYKPEYLSDKNGYFLSFKYDPNSIDYFRNVKGEKVLAPDGMPYKVQGKFIRDKNNNLIPNENGNVFRLWRPALDPALNPGRKKWKGINSPDDIWNEIINAAKIPGVTTSPKLQPIETRTVMLQSGMRANMGIKILGPSLESIEKAAFAIEKTLKEVPSIKSSTVFAPRVVSKPYLEVHIDREAIARYGIKVGEVLHAIELSVGGESVTTTVEGRERYSVRIRYMRELRDNIDALENVIITAPDGVNIPLKELATISYRKGPQMINSENGSLVTYVFFENKVAVSEAQAVSDANNLLTKQINNGQLNLPTGVSFKFAGNYENMTRADKRLMLILPLALLIIFIVLYLQFKSFITSLLVFSGITVAWSGGFIMLWLYSCPWFLNFHLFGISIQALFQVHTINLSVAVWVGFLALFGIATDDGVVMATYIQDSFAKNKAATLLDVQKNIISAGKRRIRPCLMTTATTILALLPILTSTGRGSDVMIPMAIPIWGGMLFEIITMLTVPVLYYVIEKRKFLRNNN